jgi:arabinan endo-1,5-alpha-L-arabinosidase
VRVHQVFQSKNGWLVAAPFEYTGEQVTSADIATTQQIASDRIAGKYKLLIHNYKLDHTKKKAAEPVDIELKDDGTISGASSGTWKIEEGTSYITLKIGSTYYHGVMVEQTLEPTNTKAPAFTAVAATTGTTVWGYQTEAATGVEGVRSQETVDRRLDTGVYDLHGHRISTDSRLLTPDSYKKGIYIRNGKKYLLK